ncbi:hypothetical protein OEZ86_007168 [Tetradesmus obliquus]|nr:hypothetical protein OEZ86_007168 [Tetradesmus obliquus]
MRLAVPSAAAARQPGPCLKAKTCAEQAAAAQPPEKEVSSLLGHQLRQLPATGAGSPVLAASNWEGLANQQHAELPRAELTTKCGHHLFRYRIVSGVVYADHEHQKNDILAWHRDVFLEMLLTAVWLYKGFPDVDLWVSFSDEPSRCELDIPVLQYTVIGLDTVQQAQSSSSVRLKDGSAVSVTQLLTGGGEAKKADAPAPKFYRGWAFNYPFSWQFMSYVPSVLQQYQRCLQEKVGGKPSKAQLIWRGSNTGGSRGWEPVGTSSPLLQVPWGVALANKRIALALLSRSHSDWMDVGLHELIPELMGPAGKDKQLLKDLKPLLLRNYSPQEEWGSYALQLSIDGHGSPNRLPLQYLQGSSVILKVMSPYKDAFEHRFESGVHFEPVGYDLADLLQRGPELLEKFKAGGQGREGMQRMAAAAGAKALEVFNLLGQLDALTYAILQVKSVCKWDVQQPPLQASPDAAAAAAVPGVSKADRWEVLQLQRSRDGSKCSSPSLKADWAQHIRDSMRRELSQNFS